MCRVQKGAPKKGLTVPGLAVQWVSAKPTNTERLVAECSAGEERYQRVHDDQISTSDASRDMQERGLARHGFARNHES